MKKNKPSIFLLIAFLFIGISPATLFAQNTRTVKGVVQSKEMQSEVLQPLPSANVSLLTKKDSSFVKGVVSDKDGRFKLSFVPQKGKKYLLKVSFMGLETEYKTLPDSAQINAGTFVLKESSTFQLNEVVITGIQKDIIQKEDTTVINAGSYKVPEGAYLEALLRRIPGLVYDKKEKKLIYNGEEIKRININGEDFFGSNKEMAIENLPADLVDKLKVYDKQTEKEKFTGVDDGEKSYVLDLETKKELNKTLLISPEAGYGNKNKKDLGLQAHLFNKNGNNFSLISRSSNRNLNTAYDDNIQNTVGINATKKFGKSMKLSGNVNYTLNRSGDQLIFYQEQYLPDGNQYSSSISENANENKNLNANLMGEWDIDEYTRFYINGNVGFSPNKGQNGGKNATFNAPTGLEDNDVFNEYETIPRDIRLNYSENSSLSEGKNSNSHWGANLMRKFDKEGKSILTLDVNNTNTNGTSDSYSLNNTIYYQLKDIQGNDSVFFRNQYNHSPVSNNNWYVGASFTQALTKRIRLQTSYNWSIQKERYDRNTYELSKLTTPETFGELPDNYRDGYVDSLSNRSKSRTSGHNIRIGLNYRDTIWQVRASLTLSPRKRSIERKQGLQYADTTLNTTDFQPALRITWRRKKREFNFNYNGNTSQPSLNDLMPLTDNSNPLYITRGNPDLKKTFTHGLRLDYRDTDLGLSANLGGQLQQNSVTRVVIYNTQTGGRVTYPVNINGYWTMDGGFSWWKHIEKKFVLTANVRGNYSNRVGMVNEAMTLEPVKSTTRDARLYCDARFSYNPEWGGLNFQFNWNYAQALNSFNNRNNTHNRDYGITVDGFVEFPFGLQLRTDMHYTLRNGTNVQKDEQSYILLNAGATRRFIKKRQAEISD